MTLEKTQETNQKELFKKTKIYEDALREREIMRKDLKKAEGLFINKLTYKLNWIESFLWTIALARVWLALGHTSKQSQ